MKAAVALAKHAADIPEEKLEAFQKAAEALPEDMKFIEFMALFSGLLELYNFSPAKMLQLYCSMAVNAIAQHVDDDTSLRIANLGREFAENVIDAALAVINDDDLFGKIDKEMTELMPGEVDMTGEAEAIAENDKKKIH